jgi:RimJ/RimL family protein N-acetyltransferase
VETGPAPGPERIALEGTAVCVVPLDPVAHGDALFEGAGGLKAAALWQYLFNGPFADRQTFDEWLREKAASTDPLFYAILDKGRGTAAGVASLMRIDRSHRVIEVGNILYTPALQRTRGATEAMYLLARYVFDALGYRRYEWKCNAENAPSRAAALRLGFTFEGIFRQHMIVKGRNRDTAWFSMLDREWPERRARFERWLDPANFDESGRQKAALGPL